MGQTVMPTRTLALDHPAFEEALSREGDAPALTRASVPRSADVAFGEPRVEQQYRQPGGAARQFAGAGIAGRRRRRRLWVAGRDFSAGTGAGRRASRHRHRSGSRPRDRGLPLRDRSLRRGGGGRGLARPSIFALRVGKRHSPGRGGADRRLAASTAAADPGEVLRRAARDRFRHGAGRGGAERADGRGDRASRGPGGAPQLAGLPGTSRRRSRSRSRGRVQRANRRSGVLSSRS